MLAPALALALSSLAFFARSLTSRMAASRAACRTSGFSLRFFWMTSSDTAPMFLVAGFALMVRRFRFVCREPWSFLWALRYEKVHAIFEGFFRWLKSVRHLLFRNRNDCVSVRKYFVPCPG